MIICCQLNISFISFIAHPDTDANRNEAVDQSSYEYNYDYDDLESESDHEVEGIGEEGEEEPRPSFNPQFTTEAQHFKVPTQHTVRLPCRVDRLGKKSYAHLQKSLTKTSVLTRLSVPKILNLFQAQW